MLSPSTSPPNGRLKTTEQLTELLMERLKARGLG